MSAGQTLKELLSPSNKKDHEKWSGFLQSIDDNVLFLPDAKDTIDDLAYIRKETSNIKTIPSLFIHTEIHGNTPLLALLEIGEIQNDDYRIELHWSIDLEATFKHEVDYKHYDSNGQVILASVLGDTAHAKEIITKKSSSLSHILKPKDEEQHISRLEKEGLFGKIILLKLKVYYQDIDENEKVLDRNLLHFFWDKVCVFKNLILKGGLKISHFAVMSPSTLFNVFNNRLFEMFLGLIGTEYYLIGSVGFRKPNPKMVEDDLELNLAYHDPNNKRYLLHAIDEIQENYEDGSFTVYATINTVQPIDIKIINYGNK